MLFSAHVVDSGPWQAVRRRAPGPVTVPGLKSARVAIAAPFTPGLLPRPQLGRECLLACWEDDASIDRFLDAHPVGRVYAGGWSVRLECIRAVGVWPGVDDDLPALVADAPGNIDSPTVTITIGTAYVRTALSFLRVNGGLEDQFLEASGTLWGTLMTNLPQRLVATLTLWENTTSAMDYMRNGAHGAAMREHYDPAVDPTGHTFVTGGGFFGFRPLAESGSVGGKNPIAAGLLGV